jgi:cyclopropane-fatty-acyl-phospholipid synthase
MPYRFKSRVCGDLLMLTQDAERLLQLMGYQTPAPKGIITTEQAGPAIKALEAAMRADQDPAHAEPNAYAEDQTVGLRQRAIPLLQMLKRSQAAGQPVVWGV